MTCRYFQTAGVFVRFVMQCHFFVFVGGSIDEVEIRQIRKMKELRQKLTLHDSREF